MQKSCKKLCLLTKGRIISHQHPLDKMNYKKDLPFLNTRHYFFKKALRNFYSVFVKIKKSKTSTMKNLLLLLSICVLVYSCKKDTESTETPTPVTYTSYSNLKIGNYWVYERLNHDSVGGMYTQLNLFDSSYVEKDTVINGNTYYKLMQINYPYTNDYVAGYLRDSLNFTVTSAGNIVFAAQNFADTFYTHYFVQPVADTICYNFLKMADDNLSTTVPAGVFITKNYKTTYVMWPHNATGGILRFIDCRYAKDIGLVAQTLPFFALPLNYTLRKLLRYGHS